ncbi:MAG: ComEC/Rec2 family competence protein [Planctomycetaceae bacterium]
MIDNTPMLPPTHLKNRVRQRYPAVPVVASFAAGIAADRLASLPWRVWFFASGILALSWWVCFLSRRNRWASACLLGSLLTLGGGWHHTFWSMVTANDISRFAHEKEPSLVRIRGVISESPVVLETSQQKFRPSWARLDRSYCRLKCTHLNTMEGVQPVSGSVRMTVGGHLLHAKVGDTVEVDGWLYAPRGPRNPGEFDYAGYLRGQKLHALLRVNEPDAVTVVQRGGWTWRRAIAQLREHCEFTLIQHLKGRAVSVGSAMLLGDRSGLDSRIREAFVASGMLHIFAISGLHVGILAGFVWLVCHLLNFSTRATAFAIIPVVVAYMLMTDIRPSAIRATVMIVFIVFAQPWHRRVSLWNVLALSAMILLIWKPPELFNVGAQLSFLSVMALITSENWWQRWQANRRTDDVDQLRERSWFLSQCSHVMNWSMRSALAMLLIWIFTAPLVAARFHVVSPIGMLTNLFLIPLLGFVFVPGFLLLIFGVLVPSIAFLPGAVFNFGLTCLINIAQLSSEAALGHLYVSGPREIWILIYYGLLFFAAFGAWQLRVVRWSWSAVCVWTILGLIGCFSPPSPDGLRCTFLSTGHGLSVLIETPNRRVLLYDSGSLANGNRATEAVRSALWTRGYERLDAIVISHADIDHFNGIPGLLRSLPVGKVIFAQSFLDYTQSPVRELGEILQHRITPVEITYAGDRIAIDPKVSIRVLHPSHHSHKNDNANSIVLEILYAEKRILLTGDLEKEGLEEMLEKPSRKVDVLLAPHHGSLIANPPELVKWANPRFVVVSSGKRAPLTELKRRYESNSRVFSTHLDGAITFVIDPSGTIQIESP